MIEKHWKQALENPDFVFLGGFWGGKLVGQSTFYRENNDHPWIRQNAQFAMFVLKDFWGTGLATELMQMTQDILSSWGIRRIEATVRRENARGLAFYKKFGFEIEGLRKNCAWINNEMHSEYYLAKLL